MKRYSVFHPIVMSFFSRSLYRDVGQNWRGSGFAYLLLLLAICWIPILFLFDRSLDAFVAHEAPAMIAKVPVVTIKNGNLSINADLPYIIKDEGNVPFIVINPNADYDELSKQPGQIYVMKNKIAIRKDANQTQIIDIPKETNMTLGPEQVSAGVKFINRWLAAIFYPILVISSYIYRVIQALLYAGIGSLIISRMVGVRLDYTTILRLATIAVTPVIVISTVLDIFSISFPFQLLLYFVITMLYLGFGIKANKDSVAAQERVTSNL